MTTQKKHNIKKVAIVGLGYVGIPLCNTFLNAGIHVVGLDVNETRIKELSNNKITLNHLSGIDLEHFINNKQVNFSKNFKECSLCDAIIICVPTPLDQYHQPDLSPIKSVIKSLIPHLSNNQIISLESTTYPGTCSEEIVAPIEDAGFKVGKDIHVVYSPEREDPGNKDFDCQNTPKVIGGHTDKCLKKGVELYSIVVDQPVPVSSCEVAEFSKLYENIYRSVNIGLANEMKVIADKLDLDIFEIINAAATKPFGFSAFYPGPGVGGHCIPVDPAYLNWKAKSKNVYSRLIDTAMEVNRNISDFVIDKLSAELNKRGKSINGAKLLILGVSYKSNIDDIRESPALGIIDKLLELKADISYDDSFVSKASLGKRGTKIKKVKNLTSSEASIREYNAILLLTNHDYYDYSSIEKFANLVIDTRGVFSNNKSNIERG